MSYQIYPETLTGEELDSYLEQGWYRMGQKLFTLDYIFMARWIRVFWLRYRLMGFEFGKKQKLLLKRNERFKIRIAPLDITKEHNTLYSEYFRSIDFDASPTISEFLFKPSFDKSPPKNIFDSRMIEVRDQDKLVAVGVFDLGKTSMSGILNFYHPDYRKYSPGKFMILKKIEYAIELGLSWYYPGYIGYDLPKFDYKLDAGITSAEILDPITQEWLPYSSGMVENLNQTQEQFFEPILELKDPENELLLPGE